MKAKPSAIVVLLALLFNATAATARQAAGSTREWAAVKAVPVGEKLRVEQKNGERIEGRLRSVDDTTLTLDRGKNVIELSRDSIKKVYRLIRRSTGKSVGRSTGIGAAIGFGVGAATGVALGTYEDLETTGLVALLGTAGAGIGAGIGAIAGALGSKHKKALVYEDK